MRWRSLTLLALSRHSSARRRTNYSFHYRFPDGGIGGMLLGILAKMRGHLTGLA
jgi:hypothetical protein